MKHFNQKWKQCYSPSLFNPLGATWWSEQWPFKLPEPNSLPFKNPVKSCMAFKSKLYIVLRQLIAMCLLLGQCVGIIETCSWVPDLALVLWGCADSLMNPFHSSFLVSLCPFIAFSMVSGFKAQVTSWLFRILRSILESVVYSFVGHTSQWT